METLFATVALLLALLFANAVSAKEDPCAKVANPQDKNLCEFAMGGAGL